MRGSLLSEQFSGELQREIKLIGCHFKVLLTIRNFYEQWP